MRTLWLLLLLAAPTMSRGAINDQSSETGASGTYEELQTVCKDLLLAGVQGDIGALSKFYASATNAEIREAITAAVGLYWLSRQRMVDADLYADHLNKNFPKSKYLFLLQKDANVVLCEACHGSGSAMVPCPECGGTGKCRNCGGRGTVARLIASGTTFDNVPADMRTLGGSTMTGGGTMHGSTTLNVQPSTTHSDGRITPIGGSTPAVQDPCPACGGTAKCRVCKGTKQVKGKCSLCQGTGSVFTPHARLAYQDLLNHIQNLAFAAAMTERGMGFADGRWMDRASFRDLRRRRTDEHAYFARVADEAEHAKNYDTAVRLLDKALARHPDSVYTGDVLRVKALIRAEATDSTPKELLGPEQMADAAKTAPRAIPAAINAVLDAARRGTNMPVFYASQATPVLPSKPMQWQIGAPDLLDRTARVPVNVDRPSRSGFALGEPWTFLMVRETTEWKVWRTIGP